MLTIPGDTNITEWPTSIMWFNDEILYSISKKTPQPTLEETIKTIEEFKKSLNGKKVCLLVDVTNTSESSRELKNFVAEEFPKFIKAIAMVSDSAVGKMLANLFFTLKTQPYPTKMFNNEQEAKEWLKQYL